VPDKAGCAKTGGRAADLPALDAQRTMEDVRYADAAPAERRRAPQARTTEEVNPSARLSQMPAQLLRKDRIEPPSDAERCRAVVLARRVERSPAVKPGMAIAISSSCFWLSDRSE
jgi:hypothetical protein